MKKIIKFFLAFLTLFSLVGCKSNTPYIGENGNWWVNGEDLGVPATGPKGDQGQQGETGPQGEKGEQGQAGTSVTVVSIDKTASDNNIDTYTISFSDGSKTNFNVTNGVNGVSPTIKGVSLKSSLNGIDRYEIEFTDGSIVSFQVKNGQNLSVMSVSKFKSLGAVDIYRITYSDGTYHEFSVTNGSTPYIGDNGNWWIKDVDTGIMADSSKEDKRIPTLRQLIHSSGLRYKAGTINGVSGLIVDEYRSNEASSFLRKNSNEETYFRYADLIDYEEFLGIMNDLVYENVDILVPNYVGNIPVIGMGACFNDTNIRSISLSNNTKFISKNAFSLCYKLKEVDFNNCKITNIPYGCFSETSLTDVILPETVTELDSYCFSEVELKSINLDNIIYFGSNCLDSYKQNHIFINKDVKYLGTTCFSETFVYVETETDTRLWSEDNFDDECIIFDCKKNDEYIYGIKDNAVTLYRYLGNDRVLNIASEIEGLNVTKLGKGFLFDVYITDEIKEGLYSGLGNYLAHYDMIFIPDTVNYIDRFTFNMFGAAVYIPKSVKTMWIEAFIGLDRDQFWNYLVFEGNENELPKVFDNIEEPTDIYKENLDENNVGYYLSADKTKLYFDSESRSLYYDVGENYILLSVLDHDSPIITLIDTINNKPVALVYSYAVNNLYNVKIVKIGNIKKIKSNAFYNLELKSIFVPDTVEIINHLGINSECEQIIVGNNVKPEDWDYEFVKQKGQRYLYGKEDVIYGYQGGFLYEIVDDEVKLLEFISRNKNVYIPSTIDGKPVTSIQTNFYTTVSNVNVYIPSNVTRCESNAFNRGNTYYFEASSIPTNFEFCWDYDDEFSTYHYSSSIPQYNYFGNYLYGEIEEGIILYQYNAIEDTIYIPRTINGKDVVALDGGFYRYILSNTKVYIPDTVKSFGNSDDYAFECLYNSINYCLNVYFECDKDNTLLENFTDTEFNFVIFYWNTELNY